MKIITITITNVISYRTISGNVQLHRNNNHFERVNPVCHPRHYTRSTCWPIFMTVLTCVHSLTANAAAAAVSQ